MKLKLLNTIKCDLNKSIINIGFAGAVLLTTVLAFTSSAYTDLATDKSYSVFESLFTLDKNILRTDPMLSSVLVFRNGLSGYITMFLPIVVAFPFMVSFCAERNNGLMRFTISRTGKLRYYLSKFISALISGGLAVMLGIAVYGIACAVLFQPLSEFDVSADQLQYIMQDSTGKTMWDTGAGADGKGSTANFLSGLMQSVPPLNDLFKQAGMSLPDFLGEDIQEALKKSQEEAVKRAAEADNAETLDPKDVEVIEPEK